MPLPLSAGDWIRLKRLRGARTYATDISQKKDILNKVTAANPFNPETDQSRVVGSSKTRREASKWTDYKASQVEAYVTKASNYNLVNPPTGSFTGTQLSVTRLCNCTKTVLNPKSTGCIKCNYV
jgi:hypothetical protein